MTKSVVITGGGTGIGRATAHAFAGAGTGVLIVGRDEANLRETAKGHDGIQILAADITDPAAPDRIVDTALEELGGLDVLINNAAVSIYGGLADTTRDQVMSQLFTNLAAPILLTRRALDALEDGGGTVINVSTSGSIGLRTWPDAAVFGASKVALDFLTRTWAVELAPRGIRVVGVAPGVVDSGIGLRMGMPEDAYAAFLKSMSERTPSGRTGATGEIAWWITQLVRPEAAFVNGTVIPVDGGLSLT
ncbi:SDR family oxidoreductase [Spirillospora sp. NBC_00431]